MKFEESLRFAHTCRLRSVGEAYSNISMHAMSLFKYEDIHNEVEELFRDIEAKGASFTDPIDKYLSQEIRDELDAEMNEAFDLEHREYDEFHSGGTIPKSDDLPLVGENVGC